MECVVLFCVCAVSTPVSQLIPAPSVNSHTSSEPSTSLGSLVPRTHAFTSAPVTDPVPSLGIFGDLSPSGGVRRSYGGCGDGPVAESSGSDGPVVESSGVGHYGGATVHGYGEMIGGRRLMGRHPNASSSSYYHPSTNVEAGLPSSSCRPMMPLTAGCTVHDRTPPGSLWSGNTQPTTHLGGIHGSVTTTATQPGTDVPVEALRVPSRSRRKSRAAQCSRASYSSILEARSVPCPNIDVRQIIEQQRERLQLETAAAAQSWTRSTPSTTSQHVTWTGPTSTLLASASQHMGVSMSSHSSPITSGPCEPSTSDGAAAVAGGSSSEFSRSSSSVAVTANQFTSSQQTSCIDPATSIVHTVACVTSAMDTTTVSTSPAVLITATGSSCGPGWLYAGRAVPYSQWPSHSSSGHHPLSSAVLAARSHHGQFDCLEGRQVPNVEPCQAAVPQLNVRRSVSVTSGVDVVPADSASLLPADSAALLPADSASLLPVDSASLLHQTLSSSDETATAGTTGQSPIRLVQDMVSGLETSRNSLAMATSMIMSGSDPALRRRRSGPTTADTTGQTVTSELRDPEMVQSSPERTNSSSLARLPAEDDSVRSSTTAQSVLGVPAGSADAATTVTSVLTQVVPSAYCVRPSASVHHPSVSPATPSLCEDVVNVTASGSMEPIAVSCSGEQFIYYKRHILHNLCLTLP